MTSPLFLVMAIMATAVIWLFRQTVNVRPWLEAGPNEHESSGKSFRAPSSAVGLAVFLAVATALFALIVCAYFMRMMAGDWTGMVFPSVLWLNTSVLVVSDLAMRSARRAARQSDAQSVRSALLLAGVCAFAFLAGQIWAWQKLNASGYFGGAGGAVSAAPANSFFYLFTALHGLHVLGGLLVWANTTVRAWTGSAVTKVRSSVELCTIYWRYLLIVWLILLALLYPAVSELCRGRLFA
jgi:cytochrome c oxidase subunit III